MISDAVSTELMYTISRQFSTSLDLDEVMGQVLRLTVEAAGATHGSLFLLDEQGQVIRYILARPQQAPEISQYNLEKVMTEGLTGWVYQQQQAMLLDDVATHHRWVKLPDDTETHSALAAPLLHQNRVNGVLVLHHEQPHFFDESHLSLVTGIAGQAAIAVENARLFSEIRQEREILDALVTGMPVPVLVIDAEEKIIFTNEAARQLLTLAQVGLPLAAVEGGAILRAALESLSQNPPSSTREVRWLDGRIFSLSLNHVARLGAVLTLNDITELKRLDELKSAFVETVSHDLRNPLSTIQGFAMLLEMENLSERGRST
ncbi:MAG: GAF domain-containing protein [Anaerolineales bacterium]|nr:GAF domain-containing protein [Anaerolineales bacterium]